MRHRALFFRSHTTQKELCYATASFLISFTHVRLLAPATTTTTINILVQTHLPTINNINVFFSRRVVYAAPIIAVPTDLKSAPTARTAPGKFLITKYQTVQMAPKTTVVASRFS